MVLGRTFGDGVIDNFEKVAPSLNSRWLQKPFLKLPKSIPYLWPKRRKSNTGQNTTATYTFPCLVPLEIVLSIKRVWVGGPHIGCCLNFRPSVCRLSVNLGNLCLVLRFQGQFFTLSLNGFVLLINNPLRELRRGLCILKSLASIFQIRHL